MNALPKRPGKTDTDRYARCISASKRVRWDIDYESLSYTVRIKGDATEEQFAEIHEAVQATSPNFYSVSQAVRLKPTLVVE